MIEVLFLAFALSMDAFAVSIGLGVKGKGFNKSLAFKSALLFGFFQGFMPLVGYLASVGVGTFIEAFDHWIAFVLLSLIGGKMLYESFGENTEEEISIVTNKVLLILAIATSIDAMAAGFTLSLLRLDPYLSMLIIAVVTFIFSYIGNFIGTKGGAFLEDKAEKIGGIVLIGIGLKILIEHTLLS
ncbi:manganese efflux pump MntP family protein [Halarcobacter ebronensis]|uniref:Putative manganese efflux pump MntP n=1 Tax=Halarcobacter ebronensis TaxID=1462615 RepID=A0A4Q1AZ16_9BACT|nr:manganese efflux pump MntP family protein [Halarcobacter ebronensis]QKF82602.1 manganese efflux pump MntP [Halarcobacter ebronensis]RXK07388.1 manganese efflux pump MntP [Halarcobacter ebronensis]